jgi:hypothetical protein
MVNAKVTATFSYVPYFQTVSINMIDIAEEAQPGTKFKFCLASMTFSAFTVEALANMAGEQLIPDWKQFESTSPVGKITLISRYLDINVDFSQDPWQTIAAIFKFRNLVVHSKPTKSTVEEELTDFAKLMKIPVFPENKLAKQMTVENAKKFDDCSTQIMMMWQQGAKSKKLSLTFSDSFETKITDLSN